jgi:hypothetical protein
MVLSQRQFQKVQKVLGIKLTEEKSSGEWFSDVREKDQKEGPVTESVILEIFSDYV